MKLSYLFIGGSAHGKRIEVLSFLKNNIWVPLHFTRVLVPEEVTGVFYSDNDIMAASSSVDDYESLKLVNPLQSLTPFYVFFHSSYTTPEEKIKAYEEYIK